MKTKATIYQFIFFMLFITIGKAQHFAVTGNIYNKKTGVTLEDAGIYESFNGIGTISNTNGFFRLMLKPGNAEIVVSKAGFENIIKKIELRSDTTIMVELVPHKSNKTKHKSTGHQKVTEKIEQENIFGLMTQRKRINKSAP